MWDAHYQFELVIVFTRVWGLSSNRIPLAGPMVMKSLGLEAYQGFHHAIIIWFYFIYDGSMG